MPNLAPPRPAWWRSLLLGFLAGAGAAVILAFVLVALSYLGAVPVLLIIAMGFGGMTSTLLWLTAGFVAATLIIGIAIWAWLRFAGRGLRQPARGALGWMLVSTGALFGVASAAALMPHDVKDEFVRRVTGMSMADHAPLPSSDAERQTLTQRVHPAAVDGDPAAQVELALAMRYGAAGESRDLANASDLIKHAASHPEGFEGRLLIAVSRRAEPVPRSGRIVTDDDIALQVAALRRLASDLPPDWQPVMLGTAGALQQTHSSGSHPDEQPMRDTLVEAGRAGSRGVTVLAAAYDEAAATSDEHRGRTEQADASWRRAQQGYAAAGAIYEVERLRIETLPERLATFPVPPPAAAWPAPDAALAQRFWRFARALHGDEVQSRTPPEYHPLAATAALLALERAPDPTPMSLLDPARRWTQNPWALGRFLFAQRHARGDCGAALELSNSLRHRRKAGFSGNPGGVSMHDMAWALAWAEVAERCASTDESRQHASERRLALVGMYIDAKELARARAGVTATIAALR